MTQPAERPPALAELDRAYEFLGELGQGGMAVVYHARDRALRREVAIKVIRPRLLDDEETLARFAHEARAAARLEHPHVVHVYSVERLPDGTLALVMQYVPGRTLKETVLRRGPLPVAAVERVLREVGAALAHAHERGVVHRDVKPDNIFIEEPGGRALLSDFGIALSPQLDTRLTSAGTVLGTPTYMAPEQIDNGPVDGRTDLYSLALVAWEMLTGTAPWEGEGLYSVIYKQKRESLPSLRKARPDAPAALVRALEGALRKDPAERWATMAEFLARLDEAGVAGWWRRAARHLPRRRAGGRRAPEAGAPAAPGALGGAAEPAALAETIRYRAAPHGGAAPASAAREAPAAPAEAAGSAGVPPDERVGLRFPWLVWRAAVHGERREIRRGGRVVAALVGAADLARLAADDARLAAEERAAREARELQAMLAQVRLDRAAPGRHPRWARYPHGRADYALLLQVVGMTGYRAELIMSSYGAVRVFVEDTPAGVEQRTGGGISATRAAALLDATRELAAYRQALAGPPPAPPAAAPSAHGPAPGAGSGAASRGATAGSPPLPGSK